MDVDEFFSRTHRCITSVSPCIYPREKKYEMRRKKKERRIIFFRNKWAINLEILGGRGNFFRKQKLRAESWGESKDHLRATKRYLHIIWYGERKGDGRLGWEWERDMIRNISSNGSMYLYYLVFYDIMYCIGL